MADQPTNLRETNFDMNYDNNDLDVAKQLGSMNTKLTSIKESQEKFDARILDVEKKVSKMDVVFGKIGVVVTIIGFIVATIWNFIIDWAKEHLFK